MNEYARPSRMKVDLGALARNYAVVRSRTGANRKLIASIKGNAYGHGAVEIAKFLAAQDVFGFWTGSLAEARELREAGITTKIIMFGGYREDQIPLLLANDLSPTVFDDRGLAAVAAAAGSIGREISLYVKVDAGLGRLGVSIQTAFDFVVKASQTPCVRVEGVYTHLPFNSDPGEQWAKARYALFEKLLSDLARRGINPDITQVWGSSGVLGGLPDICNAVCVGHLLYGLVPAGLDCDAAQDYVPILSVLSAPIVHIGSVDQSLRASAYRGRGGCSSGVIGFGLCDGVLRPRGEHKFHALVHGRRVPVIGTSLEHSILDLDCIDSPQIGDQAILIGHAGQEEITVKDWAKWCDCTPLEVLMSLSKRTTVEYRPA